MITNFSSLEAEAKRRGGGRIAIAGAAGPAVLEAARIAQEDGIMIPLLVGDHEKIAPLAEEVGLNLKYVEIIQEADDVRAAEVAVALVDAGKADGVMKGKVSTPNLLKAVLNKNYNLRTDRLLSHIALLELPAYHKFLMVTDGGMVIQPTLDQKVSILKNGVEMMQRLVIVRPKVAVLAAIEKVNPEMAETVDAQKIVEMAHRGELGDIEVEGPMAVDIALSPEAARVKGVESRISGDPDILLVPNVACGNIFAKGLWHLAGAKIAGLILGARCPVILLSRSDNAVTKLNSSALAVVTS